MMCRLQYNRDVLPSHIFQGVVFPKRKENSASFCPFIKDLVSWSGYRTHDYIKSVRCSAVLPSLPSAATSSTSSELLQLRSCDLTSCMKLLWNIFFFWSCSGRRCSLLQQRLLPSWLLFWVSVGVFYYAVELIKALEFASSLFLPLDYSVSMDTWLQFPLQSANQRLKTGSRSVAVLWRLYPSRHCFIFVSSSSIVQRRFCFLGGFLIWRFPVFIADSYFIALRLSVTHYQCQRCWWKSFPLKRAQMEAAIWSFSTRK